MSWRSNALVVFALSALLSIASIGQVSKSAGSNVVGIYAGKLAGSSRNLTRLEVRKDHRWAMADMLTGYWGTWSVKGKTITFLCTEGPAGKLKKPDKVAATFKGKSDLVLSIGKKLDDLFAAFCIGTVSHTLAQIACEPILRGRSYLDRSLPPI